MFATVVAAHRRTGPSRPGHGGAARAWPPRPRCGPSRADVPGRLHLDGAPGRSCRRGRAVLRRACQRGGRSLHARRRSPAVTKRKVLAEQRRGDATAGPLQLFRCQRPGRDRLDQGAAGGAGVHRFRRARLHAGARPPRLPGGRDERAGARAAMSDDLYATLGVGRDASQEDIKRRLPQARQGDASRPQSGQAGGRRALQAGDRRLRHPVRPREARALRSRRDRRQRPGAAAVPVYRDFAEDPAAGRYYTREGFGNEEELHDFFEGLFGGRGRGGRLSHARARRRRLLHPADRLPGGGQGRQEAGHDGRRPHHRSDHPARRSRSPDPAPQGPGHARVRGRPAGRRLRRAARPAAPLLRAQGPQHPHGPAGERCPRRCSAAGSRCRPSTAR